VGPAQFAVNGLLTRAGPRLIFFSLAATSAPIAVAEVFFATPSTSISGQIPLAQIEGNRFNEFSRPLVVRIPIMSAKKLLTVTYLGLLTLVWLNPHGAMGGGGGGGGGESPFPKEIEAVIGGDKVKLVRTGTAVRKSAGFKVYNVASYLGRGVKLQTAEQLAQADQPKQLELIFLLTVAGDEMADSFRNMLRQNYPEPAFAEEVKALTGLLQKAAVKRGDHVWITHIPKVGLQCRRENKEEVLIRNVDFSKAVWDNYFGENNCSELVKRALVSELTRQ
jgi:Chalcone isomerase-like